MSLQPAHLRPVDPVDLPEYPISIDDRIDSHYFLQWNLKRWRGSDFRRHGYKDPEVGWYGMELFFLSQDEAPVGTLPCDETALAFLLRLSVSQWRELAARAVSPLHGWSRVQCDNGEVRLAHPIVKAVAVEALKSKRQNQSNQEDRKRAKRIKDLREMIESRIGAGQLLRAAGFLDRFNDWLEDTYPDVQRREAFVRRALDQFQEEMAG